MYVMWTFWFRFTKYGYTYNTWHKWNLDKIIATGILQGKENSIAPRLVIYFNLTSAEKSWWIDCTETSLMDSEISENRSPIIQTPTSIATKQWSEILQVSGPDPAWYKYLLRGGGGRGGIGLFLGQYVPPGTPNWHPALKVFPLKLIPRSRNGPIFYAPF